MTTHQHHDAWRTSSFSNSGNGCVEIAPTLGAVRDSKNRTGPVLILNLRGFVTAVKDGRLG